MADLIPPIPNLAILCRCLIQYIASHPLVISPVVVHPLTGEKVYINAYRNFDGIEVRSGLTCSVFAYAGSSGGIPTPNSMSTSAVFAPYDIGSGMDECRFHLVIKYSYNEVILGKTTEMQIPASAVFGVGQRLLTSNTNRNVTLEINPGIEIIQNYLSVTKIIIDDVIHKRDFPIPANSFEVVSFNVKSKRWEEDDTIYFQEGVAMTLFQAHMAKGWRDDLLPLYAQRQNINTTIN